MPRVSVVIPAHNAERTIEATIRSVLNQTYRDLEVVIVDDGSADTTGSRAAAYGPPVTYLRTPNRGVSAARNLGIETAQGELGVQSLFNGLELAEFSGVDDDGVFREQRELEELARARYACGLFRFTKPAVGRRAEAN